MTASPGDGNWAKRLALALVLLSTAIGSGFVASNAEAKQKKHQSAATDIQSTKASTPASAPTGSDGPTSPLPVTGKVGGKGAGPQQPWTQAEIADAKARCAAILNRVHAVVLSHEPIRDGACGAPAPVELVSIGKNPEVALSPPAIVRCNMIEPLSNWIENNVQPLARKHLKSQIIKIETMSSYDCRNAYGRKTTRLSEHALADAIDIGGFVTASARTAEVLDDWGKPQREIVAEAEARKQAAEDAAAKTAQAGVAGNPMEAAPPSPLPATAATAAAGLARSTIIDGMPRNDLAVSAVSGSDLNHLGGPVGQPGERASPARKTAYVSARSIDNPDPQMRAFLHEAHDAACRIFGTTLGPEANADHRNHFHVDMAPRTFTKICD